MSADELRARLVSIATKIPAGINSASIQRVREYGRWVGQARKAINTGTRNSQTLQSLLNQYEAFK